MVVMAAKIWKNEIASHLIVTFVYFFLVLVLRLGELGRLGVLGVLGMWGGALFGTFFLDIDHLFFWFVTRTETQDAIEARGIIQRTRGIRGIRRTREITKELYKLLKKVHFTHTRLVFHSVVGQVVLLILAFYLLTSGGSVFGSAFILSVNLHLLKDQWVDYQKNKGHLADWLFWQIRGGSEKTLKVYLSVVSLVFLCLSLLML